MKVGHSLTLYTKINSKWIKHPSVKIEVLNVGPKILRVIHRLTCFDILGGSSCYSKRNKQL